MPSRPAAPVRQRRRTGWSTADDRTDPVPPFVLHPVLHPVLPRARGCPMNVLSPRPAQAGAPPLHDARVLTEGGATAQIALNGQTYTLRITRQGKLILTK